MDCRAEFDTSKYRPGVKRCRSCQSKHRDEYERKYYRENGMKYRQAYKEDRGDRKIEFLSATPAKFDDLSCYFGRWFHRRDFLDTVKMGYFDGGIVRVDDVMYHVERCRMVEVKNG
jgi:hypothetical protein